MKWKLILCRPASQTETHCWNIGLPVIANVNFLLFHHLQMRWKICKYIISFYNSKNYLWNSALFNSSQFKKLTQKWSHPWLVINDYSEVVLKSPQRSGKDLQGTKPILNFAKNRSCFRFLDWLSRSEFWNDLWFYLICCPGGGGVWILSLHVELHNRMVWQRRHALCQAGRIFFVRQKSSNCGT